MNTVAIFSGEGFTGDVVSFSAVRCQATLGSRVIKAPIEGGAQSFDNKVRDPIEVKIVGKINLLEERAQRDIATIVDMYRNRDFKFYSVTTKDNAFDRMILRSAVDKTDDKEFDLVTYELEFVEAMIVQGSSRSSYDQANDDSIVTGFRSVVQ